MWDWISYYKWVEVLFLFTLTTFCLFLAVVALLISIDVIPNGWAGFIL